MSNFDSLVPCQLQDIDGVSTLTCDARDLHAFLNIQKPFAPWIKIQIKRARLIENIDVIVYYQEVINSKGGRPSVGYTLTADAAKSISMLSATEKGDQARKYFIECERRFFESQERMPAIKNPATQIAIETLIRIDAMEQRQIEQDKAIAKAQQNALEALSAQQWITIRQYVAIHQMTRQLPPGTEQQQYGRWLAGYCQEQNLPIYKQESEHYKEWTYPVWTIQQTLHAWLARRHGQGPIRNLEIGEDGVSWE